MIILLRHFLLEYFTYFAVKTSVLFVIVLLILELLMHTVSSFKDGLFRMLAKIKAFSQLDDFQNKPWSNRTNCFLYFHWEASKLKAISPAHLLKIQASAGVVALTFCCVLIPPGHRGPTCAGFRWSQFIHLWGSFWISVNKWHIECISHFTRFKFQICSWSRGGSISLSH